MTLPLPTETPEGAGNPPGSVNDGVRQVFEERDGAAGQPDPATPSPPPMPATPKPEQTSPITPVAEPATPIPTPDGLPPVPAATDKEPATPQTYEEYLAAAKTAYNEVQEMKAGLLQEKKAMEQDYHARLQIMRDVGRDTGVGDNYDTAIKDRREFKKVTGEMPPPGFEYKSPIAGLRKHFPNSALLQEQNAAALNYLVADSAKQLNTHIASINSRNDQRIEQLESQRLNDQVIQQRTIGWEYALNMVGDQIGMTIEQKRDAFTEVSNSPYLAQLVDNSEHVSEIIRYIRSFVYGAQPAMPANIQALPDKAPPPKVATEPLNTAASVDQRVPSNIDPIELVFNEINRQ